MTRLPACGVHARRGAQPDGFTHRDTVKNRDWFLLTRRFEQLDRVSVRILDLNLASAWADFHLIPKVDASILQGRDARLKIRNAKHDTVPTTRFLALTVRQWPRA